MSPEDTQRELRDESGKIIRTFVSASAESAVADFATEHDLVREIQVTTQAMTAFLHEEFVAFRRRMVFAITGSMAITAAISFAIGQLV